VLALAAINSAAIRAALFDRSLYYVSFPRHLLRVLSRFAIHFVTSASATIARGDRQEILCLLHSASPPSPSPLPRARARARDEALRFFRESARRWSFRLVLARARIRYGFQIKTRRTKEARKGARILARARHRKLLRSGGHKDTAREEFPRLEPVILTRLRHQGVEAAARTKGSFAGGCVRKSRFRFTDKATGAATDLQQLSRRLKCADTRVLSRRTITEWIFGPGGYLGYRGR